MVQSIFPYKNLKQINIIDFWEIANEHDYKRLDELYSETNQYTEEQIKELESTFYSLYDAYFTIKNESKEVSEVKSTVKENESLFQIGILENIQNTFKFIQANQMVLKPEDVAEFKHTLIENIKLIWKKTTIRELDSTETIISKLEKTIKSLTNIFELEIKRKKQAVKKEVVNFYLNIANVEQVLGRSLGDISKVNCLQWLAYEKQVIEIDKHNKLNNGRK